HSGGGAGMFAVGVLGNVVAAAVLCASRREQKETAFYTLVCGMAVTDLLGTCFTSPVVIATYVAGRWPGGARLCHFFSFSMLFFGSAGMSILCAMAVERYVAIDHAYFYSKRVDRRTARAALLAVYAANAALCALPSLGFGRHARHVPGTWCFLDWRATDAPGAAYSYLYGGVMLALIAVTVACNCAACRSLVRMSRETRAGGTGRRALAGLPAVTSAAEIQMFWMLIIMTVVFLICSIPLVVRIFVNQIYGPAEIAAGRKPDYRSDLLAIRFASFNPILDPWVYILCRKSLFTKGCEWLKRTVGHSRERHERTLGWVSSQHSPPSLTHSNNTSYASLRMPTCRNAAEKQTTMDTKPYGRVAPTLHPTPLSQQESGPPTPRYESGRGMQWDWTLDNAYISSIFTNHKVGNHTGLTKLFLYVLRLFEKANHQAKAYMANLTDMPNCHLSVLFVHSFIYLFVHLHI
uniref:Prostaglandin E receptor 4 (subtype EP4) c n=1 Tax=Pygocentrus nattereri TaxID=42514 RepID=A0A3B4BWQ9_PYGNA